MPYKQCLQILQRWRGARLLGRGQYLETRNARKQRMVFGRHDLPQETAVFTECKSSQLYRNPLSTYYFSSYSTRLGIGLLSCLTVFCELAKLYCKRFVPTVRFYGSPYASKLVPDMRHSQYVNPREVCGLETIWNRSDCLVFVILNSRQPYYHLIFAIAIISLWRESSSKSLESTREIIIIEYRAILTRSLKTIL